MNPIQTTHRASIHDRDNFWTAEAREIHWESPFLVKDYL